MSIWKKIKRGASSALKTSSPYAKYAVPAILPGLAVSPFIYQALKAKQKAKRIQDLSKQDQTNLALRAVSLHPGDGEPGGGGGREVEADEDFLVDDESGWGDEYEAGLLAGGVEREMMVRMRGRGVGVGSGGGVPAEVYRAGVWQRAMKMSGGRRPDAKTLMKAQSSVNRDLGRRGVGIVIPGARPGRVTR